MTATTNTTPVQGPVRGATAGGAGQRIRINDVVMRDGFQMEAQFVPTEDKVRLAELLAAAGCAKVEVSSFTSPKAIPSLRDAEAVFGQIRRQPGVLYTALVPNVRGAERALESRVDEFNVVMSVSETHNRSNLRMTREQSYAQLREVIALAAQHGIPVNVSLSTCFGCPMQGDVPASAVLEWVGRFAQLGVAGVTLCDTTGMAHPAQVRALCEAVRAAHPQLDLTLHFHDTRGLGLANTLAALDAGITSLDASLGGLGGCPYAPGATGNVCTEEMVHMLELMGYDTGVDVDRLLEAARLLPEMVGHDVPSALLKAGKVDTLHPAPEAAACGVAAR